MNVAVVFGDNNVGDSVHMRALLPCYQVVLEDSREDLNHEHQLCQQGLPTK
jgi:hypothetical protein